MNPDLTVGILAFIAFAVPIVGALWRIFSIREALQAAIANNAHRLDLIEQELGHLRDQQELAINGIREVSQHVRDRSQRNEEKLSDRLLDIEAFLEKSTPFNRRHIS
jgi:hypothetical protein